MHPLVKRFHEQYGRLPTEFDRDYLEMLRMTKYIIKDAPQFPPSKCANCGTSKVDGRQYIDFGLTVDWFGVVYLCGYCVKDITKDFGFFKPYEIEIASLREQIASLKKLLTKGSDLNENVVKTFKEYEEFYAGLHSTVDDRNPSGITDLGTDPPAVEQGTTELQSRTSKPATGTGRKNLPSLADLLNANPE